MNARLLKLAMLSFLAADLTACSRPSSFWPSSLWPNSSSDTQAETATDAVIETKAGDPLIDTATPGAPTESTLKTETTVPETKTVAIKSPPPVIPPATNTQGVELVWQRPADPVTVYHLRFGLSANALDQYARVPVANLEKIDDLSQGPLFRYVLKGVPNGKDVYVSMQAENQYGMSPASEPMLIPAH